MRGVHCLKCSFLSTCCSPHSTGQGSLPKAESTQFLGRGLHCALRLSFSFFSFFFSLLFFFHLLLLDSCCLRTAGRELVSTWDRFNCNQAQILFSCGNSFPKPLILQFLPPSILWGRCFLGNTPFCILCECCFSVSAGCVLGPRDSLDHTACLSSSTCKSFVGFLCFSKC